jgi:glycosyltransferase involved in cell wall biosynthesis
LSILDVFCLTSFKEGLPISLIEAMAAGLSIVGTDVEGIRDVIISNKNGILVKTGDVDGLKNALQTVIKNETLRKKFAEESRILVNNTFSLDTCVKQYQNLFLTVI